MCTSTSTGSQDFIFPLIHPSGDLSIPKLSVHRPAGFWRGALTLLGVHRRPALALFTVYTHSRSHSRTLRDTLAVLAQRLDRSPPVRRRNSETDGITTSLLFSLITEFLCRIKASYLHVVMCEQQDLNYSVSFHF